MDIVDLVLAYGCRCRGGGLSTARGYAAAACTLEFMVSWGDNVDAIKSKDECCLYFFPCYYCLIVTTGFSFFSSLFPSFEISSAALGFSDIGVNVYSNEGG